MGFGNAAARLPIGPVAARVPNGNPGGSVPRPSLPIPGRAAAGVGDRVVYFFLF